MCACSNGWVKAVKSYMDDSVADTDIVQLPEEDDDYSPALNHEDEIDNEQDDIGKKYNLNSVCVEFLKEHNIDFDALVQEYAQEVNGTTDEILSSNQVYQYNQSLRSLINEVQTYDFTDEQIEKYIIGFISTPSTIERSSLSGDGAVSLAAVNRPTDSGIGYEVKTVEGYFQETAFVVLPDVYRVASSQYMFFTVSGSETPWCIDVGLWYANGNRGEGWRACYTADKVLGSSKIIPELSAGKELYFNVRVQSDGFLRFRILDSQDFSIVYYDMLYDVQSHGIYQDNTCINRQISLCNDSADFTDGSYCLSAEFKDVYVYNIVGGVQPNDEIVQFNRCGAFGTNDDNRTQVVVNSFTPWCQENVSIFFNDIDALT
jgi:hypothetical protein